MKQKIILIFFTIFLFQNLITKAQKLDIALFFDSHITALTLAPDTGSYVIFADSNLIKLNNKDVISINFINDSLNIKNLEKNLGNYKNIKISGIGKVNSFKIKPTEPSLPQRIYDDGVLFRTKYGKIEIINQVEMDNYLAGVVETEGGSKAEIEFYKAHAVISRTYTFANLEKHTFEGFNLCDGVHCQAYKGKSTKNKKIIEATYSTHDLVIVDTLKQYIQAAFHSNCGGITENSENVWVGAKSYLTSVNDSFCLQKRNAKWTMEIPADDWKKYLERFGAKVPETNYAESFRFIQNQRKNSYDYGGVKLPLKDIRSDWKFRSSFFSIEPAGTKLIINGRGYGHGVGLCQEGSMRMAELGYNFNQIIKKYYKNVEIVSHSSLIQNQSETQQNK